MTADGLIADLLSLRDDLIALEDVAIKRPLTLWRAWDRADPRTSQRRALQLVALFRVLFVFGGNRSGKTELLRAVVVALVIGSDHPDAREFWEAHGVDPDVFPRGPGFGWIMAIRVADSLTYHRQQTLALIPKWGPQHPDAERGHNWHAWGMMGTGEAVIQIMCPGYDEPAEIRFKSDDPGPDTMQGAEKIRCILHDEESRKWGNLTWEECAVRLIDLRGWHLMSNTPTKGRTWLWHEHVNAAIPGEAKTWIHAPDNPYLPPSELKKLERDPATAAIRLRGEFVALEGRVWGAFSRAVHVVPAFEIPEGSGRWRAIDFGTRHPFCCSWFTQLSKSVLLPDGRTMPDGAIVVYREHYRAEWTLEQHVNKIHAMEGATFTPTPGTKLEGDPVASALAGEPIQPGEWVGGEPIDATWCDQEDPQQMLQLAHTHEIENLVRAKKAIAAGLNCVREYLAPGFDGRPGWFVVDTCVDGIGEAENYCKGPGDTEKPTGQVDHAMDTWRYGAMGITASNS